MKTSTEQKSRSGQDASGVCPVGQKDKQISKTPSFSDFRAPVVSEKFLSSAIRQSPRVAAQRKKLDAIFGITNEAAVPFVPNSKSPVQRVLDVTAGDFYFDTEDADLTLDNAPPALVTALNKANYKDHKVDLLRVLNAWKNDDSFEDEFQHWGAAVYQAKQSLDVDVPEVVALDSIDIPKKPTDAADTKTLYFTAEGKFSNEEGEKLSGAAVNMLTQSLVLTHVYDGHGPGMTDEALRSKCLTEGVSGKWATDFDAMKAVAEVYRLIGTGAITPSSGFKLFDTAGINSLNLRKRTKDETDMAYPVPASKAKCGFKKHTGDTGDYYTLKTVFPYPEKVNDDGAAEGY